MPLVSSCQDHPNALAIDNCTKCKAALCDMCANFVDDKVFCEGCVKTHEAKKFVSSQNKKISRAIIFFSTTRAENNMKVGKGETQMANRGFG